MRRTTAALATLTAAVLPLTSAPSCPSPTREACHEDAPCWNWATMGDHKRGVIIIAGRSRTGKDLTRKVVATPCEYQHLRRAGLVHASTPHLRGDATAMRFRCHT